MHIYIFDFGVRYLDELVFYANIFLAFYVRVTETYLWFAFSLTLHLYLVQASPVVTTHTLKFIFWCKWLTCLCGFRFSFVRLSFKSAYEPNLVQIRHFTNDIFEELEANFSLQLLEICLTSPHQTILVAVPRFKEFSKFNYVEIQWQK